MTPGHDDQLEAMAASQAAWWRECEHARRRAQRGAAVWLATATVAVTVGWVLWWLSGPWWLAAFHGVATAVVVWQWAWQARERRAARRQPWVCPYCGDRFTADDEDIPPVCGPCRQAGREVPQ